MSHSKLILKNAFSMLVVRVLTPLSALILFVYASRKYSVEEIGKYSLLLAFYQMVQYLALLGLMPYLVKEIAKDKTLANKYILNMCWIVLPASILVCAGLYGVGILFRYPADVLHGMLWLFLLVIIGTIAVIYESVFVAYEKIDLIAVVVAIETVLRLVASVLLIKTGFGFTSLILTMALSRFFATGLYVVIMRQISHPGAEGGAGTARIDFSFIKELLGICRIFFAISLCSTLINRVDFVLLSKLRSFKEVAFYTASYRVLDICVLIASTLIFVIFPFLSRLYYVSTVETLEATKKFIKYLSILVIFLVSLVFSFAGQIITLFYSKNYEVSVGILRILIFTAFFLSLDQVFAGLFIISNNQKLDLKVLLVGTFIYLMLLLALIPPFGYYGAAIATVLAMICQLGVRYFYFKKYVFHIPLFHLVWKPILAGFLMVLSTRLFSGWLWFWLVPLSVGLYGLFLFALGTFGKEDLAFFIRLKPGAL